MNFRFVTEITWGVPHFETNQYLTTISLTTQTLTVKCCSTEAPKMVNHTHPFAGHVSWVTSRLKVSVEPPQFSRHLGTTRCYWKLSTTVVSSFGNDLETPTWKVDGTLASLVKANHESIWEGSFHLMLDTHIWVYEFYEWHTWPCHPQICVVPIYWVFNGFFLMAISCGKWLPPSEIVNAETRNCEAHTSKGGRIPLENKVPGHSAAIPFRCHMSCMLWQRGMLLMLVLNHTLSTSYYSVH